MTRSLALIVAAVIATSSAAALAQDNPQARCRSAPSAADGHQEFCFENENVRGSREGGVGEDVRGRRRLHGTPLIRYRLHFVNEMLKSAENR